MPNRRDYQDGSLTDKVKAVAGTVKGKAQQAKEKAAQKVRNRRARKELEDYRSEEVTDQAEARRERARMEARREAERIKRQRELEEIREQERQELLEDDDSGGLGLGSLFEPADDPMMGGPQLPGGDMGPQFGMGFGEPERDERDDRQPYVPMMGPETGPAPPMMGNGMNDDVDDDYYADLFRL